MAMYLNTVIISMDNLDKNKINEKILKKMQQMAVDTRITQLGRRFSLVRFFLFLNMPERKERLFVVQLGSNLYVESVLRTTVSVMSKSI